MSGFNWRDSVMISRLQIGHIRLAHCDQLACEDQSECAHCKCPLTVKYFLHEYAATAKILYWTVYPQSSHLSNIGQEKWPVKDQRHHHHHHHTNIIRMSYSEQLREH